MTIFLRLSAAALLLASAVMADSDKLSRDLDRNPSTDVIVQFSSDPDTKMLQKLAASGAVLKQYFGNVKAGVFSVPGGSAKAKLISNEKTIEYMSPDRPVFGHLDRAVSSIYGSFAYTRNTGAGVAVAVIDSGVNSTDDLEGRGRVIFRMNLTGDGSNKDLYGHGTHVASMIAGDGEMSNGREFYRTFAGVAPGANIVALKVLDRNGKGSESAVIRAIDTAIGLKNLLNIKVINLSLGRPVLESYKTDPICRAVEAAWRAGIVVVVAAGNEGRNNLAGTKGYGMIMSPGNDPLAITVGAMKDMANNGSRTDDRIASYSSKGPSAIDHVVKPDLVAPGNRIIANAVEDGTLFTSAPTLAKVMLRDYKYTNGRAFSEDYISLSGTSMSAALVSGAAALMAADQSGVSPDTIKARMMKTAYKTFPVSSTTMVNGTPFVSYYDIFTVGAGYLDVQAAIRNRDVVRPNRSAASPVATRVRVGNRWVFKMVSSSNIVWGGDGADAVWDNNIVWGGDDLVAENIVWGGDSDAVWGDPSVGGFNIVWGSNIVWGGDGAEEVWSNLSRSPRSFNIVWGGLTDEGVTIDGDLN